MSDSNMETKEIVILVGLNCHSHSTKSLSPAYVSYPVNCTCTTCNIAARFDRFKRATLYEQEITSSHFGHYLVPSFFLSLISFYVALIF